MNEREEIEMQILEKEDMLMKAKKESTSWNGGKYKKSSNASTSIIYIKSLENEISNLKDKLNHL